MDHFQSWVFLLMFLWHSTPLVEFFFLFFLAFALVAAMDHFQSWVFLLMFLWHSTPLVEFYFFVVAKLGLEVFILVTRLRARALVELSSSQDNLGVSQGLSGQPLLHPFQGPKNRCYSRFYDQLGLAKPRVRLGFFNILLSYSSECRCRRANNF